MKIPSKDLLSALFQFNPWLVPGKPAMTLPEWRRSAFAAVLQWVQNPPQRRAVLLGGARQVGKTTIFRQVIQSLLQQGVPAGNVLYCTFDHPLFRAAGLEAVLQTWREFQPKLQGPEFLFLDEIQLVPDWQTWLKHQVDFEPNRRIAITGSATPLLMDKTESGVGRWHTITLPTLSFYEYQQLRRAAGKPEVLPEIPDLPDLNELFDWSEGQFLALQPAVQTLQGLFSMYLLRGGFPQSALTDSVELAQQFLREDILDKVLKRDMTALYGVRHPMELEQMFLYLCMHDGERLDFSTLTENLGTSKSGIQNYLELLKSTYLIHTLRQFGYGKQVLRSQLKVYLSDPAIASSVLVRGQSVLEDPEKMGLLVESACFKHLLDSGGQLSFWRGKKNQEVDLVFQRGEQVIPFEVKFRSQHTTRKAIPGMLEFLRQKKLQRGVVFTRQPSDFSLEHVDDLTILRIPASLGCHLLGRQTAEQMG